MRRSSQYALDAVANLCTDHNSRKDSDVVPIATITMELVLYGQENSVSFSHDHLGTCDLVPVLANNSDRVSSIGISLMHQNVDFEHRLL